MTQKFNFGVTVRDCITGLQGVVTGFTTYITGCSQYLVQQPVDEKGASREPRWIDEARLVDQRLLLVTLPQEEPAVRENSGADLPAPIR